MPTIEPHISYRVDLLAILEAPPNQQVVLYLTKPLARLLAGVLSTHDSFISRLSWIDHLASYCRPWFLDPPLAAKSTPRPVSNHPTFNTIFSIMCNYIYKELSCQHHYHLVESWCPKYIETERRCPPTIVSKQYW
jgi:hypothetical protein